MSIKNACKKIVEQCMKIKKGEKVLILYDINKKDVARHLFSASEKISSSVYMLKVPVGKVNGEEPPKYAAKKMQDYDVILIATTKSLSHTKARRDATKKGARIASMPTITKDILNRCIDIDYNKLKIFHDKLRKILIRSKKVRITTKLGTEVTTSVKATRGEAAGLMHSKGDFGNLPAGEVDSGVKEGSTNGKIVVDASFAGVGKLRFPITLEVKKGYAVSIKGNQGLKLKNILKPHGKKAYKIAELGIGTNPKAKVTGVVLEDEKVLGTLHFALGNDISYKGRNDVGIHLDGVINKPDIYVDDKLIMKDGKFLI